MKRLFGLISDVFGVLKAGNIFYFLEKRLSQGDGTYKRYAFMELPYSLTKTRKFMFVACPDMIREVLHQDASANSPSSSFSMGWVGETFEQELGEILFVLSHEDHALLRGAMSQFFRQHVDKRFGENLITRANAFIDTWLKNKNVNATDELNFFSSQVIIDHFIGYVADPRHLHETMKVILLNLERMLTFKRPLSKRTMEKARKTIAEVSREACQRSTEGTSLLKVLFDAKDTLGNPLFSQAKVEGMARFLFLAGQITVGSVLPALLHHCTEEYQNKVREEWTENSLSIDSVEDVTNFAKKSQWIQALINEALRLFPPAYSIARVCTKDTHVQDVFIPCGTTLSLCLIFSQKDRRYWGQNAREFVPERWFDNQAQGKAPPFMPFGIGPNNCLGQPFARLEIGLLLTLFCLRIKWTSLVPYQPSIKIALSTKQDIRLAVSPIHLPPFSSCVQSVPSTAFVQAESKCPFR